MRKQLEILIIDISASIELYKDKIKKAVIAHLNERSNENHINPDVETQILLILFNDDAFMPSTKPLPPKTVIDLFDANFHCSGYTSFVSLFNKLLQLFGAQINSYLSPGDAYPEIVIITDYATTDVVEDVGRIQSNLKQNILFKHCSKLCYLLSPTDQIEAAACLVDGVDNVFPIKTNEDINLMSSIMSSVSKCCDTTILENSIRTTRDIAEEQKQRKINGNKSAVNQRDFELEAEIRRLFGLES